MININYILLGLIFFLLTYIFTTIINLVKVKYEIIKYNKKNNTKIIIICDDDISDYKYYNLRGYLINYIYKYDIININNYQLITQITNNNNNITIIIESTGGDIISNDNVIHVLINKNNIKTYILTEAKSAATMIVFASSKIYMSKYAILGPTDPQVTLNNHIYSVKSLINLCENKSKDYISDEYLINYYDNKKLYDENKDNIVKLLSKHYIKNISNIKKQELIDTLTNGDISHHIPIGYNYLKKYLKIDTNISQSILDLYSNYKKI
jgi:ClpP class serine protease